MHVVEWQSSSWLVYHVWEGKKYFFQTSLLIKNLPEGRGKLSSVTAVQYLSTNWKNITSRSVPRNDLQQIGDVQSYHFPAVMPFCKVKDHFLQTEI